MYEGRGWQNVGAHATGHNSNSIGIVFIGNFVCKSRISKDFQGDESNKAINLVLNQETAEFDLTDLPA